MVQCSPRTTETCKRRMQEFCCDLHVLRGRACACYKSNTSRLLLLVIQESRWFSVVLAHVTVVALPKQHAVMQTTFHTNLCRLPQYFCKEEVQVATSYRKSAAGAAQDMPNLRGDDILHPMQMEAAMDRLERCPERQNRKAGRGRANLPECLVP